MKRPTPEDARANAAKGKQLLSAVERILASNESIKAVVRECSARAKARDQRLRGEALRSQVSRLLIKRYSDRAALVGGAASLPGIFPGVGSLALGLGGLLTELGVLLKLEVELALALSHLHGFDIDAPEERQLAFLMASVGTYDATGGNFFVDLARTEGVALWNYGPRQLGKFLVTAATGLALTWLWRGFFKLVPFVGIAVGSGVNKVLTVRVGERIAGDLATRASLAGDAKAAPRSRTRKQAKKAAPSKRAPEAAPPPSPGSPARG